jgi:hypothetical protein
MDTSSLIIQNLFSPLTLAFMLGVAARLIKSDLEFPEAILKTIGIYLLFSLGLQGGIGLREVELQKLILPLAVTFLIIILMPIWNYFIARKVGKLSIENSAGIAALYSSVSSVTFITAVSFASFYGTPSESYITSIVSFMELSVLVALVIARVALGKKAGSELSYHEIVIDTLRGRSFILLIGGILIGLIIGPSGFESIKPVFEDPFRGVLTLFLLEMGMVAASQIKEFLKVGKFMFAFGILMPILHGALGAFLGTISGLSVGGSFVFASILASASYIDAPAVVRATLPKANPSIYLTSSLGVTFPFNLIFGLPLYYQFAIYFSQILN